MLVMLLLDGWKDGRDGGRNDGWKEGRKGGRERGRVLGCLLH